MLNNTKDENQLYSKKIYQRQSNLKANMLDFDGAMKNYIKAEKSLQNTASIDYVFYYHSLTSCSILKKDFSSAEMYLKKIHDYPNMDKIPISIHMTVLFWKEMIPDSKVSLRDRVALRANLIFCPFSYLIKKKYNPQSAIPLTLFYGQKYIKHNNNYWKITNKKITTIKYNKIIESYSNSNKVLIDLYSGVTLNHSEEGMIRCLSDIQVKCLCAIYGGGSLGVSKWSLVDYVYQQEFYHPRNGEKKLKSLIKKLKKSFLIKHFKNFYFLPELSEGVILLPMNLGTSGKYHFLRSLRQNFSHQNIKHIFNIKNTTTKTWLKN